MSDAYQRVLADLYEKRAQVNAAIEALEPLAGVQTAHGRVTVPLENVQAAFDASQGRPARPMHASSEALRASVLAALKTHGPMRSMALAQAVDVRMPALVKHLKRMVEAGQITRKGSTNSTTYFLP